MNDTHTREREYLTVDDLVEFYGRPIREAYDSELERELMRIWTALANSPNLVKEPA